MTVDWQRVLSSRAFRFIVGPQQREFTLHAEVVAALSGPLNALVNGDMKEAQESCAVWSDTDEETFIRFCQYAYTGNYSPANPQVLEPSSPLTREAIGDNEADPEVDNSWYLPSATKKSKKSTQSTQSKRSELWDAFKARRYVESLIPEPTCASENADYTGVFLSHARLFVFADCYQIPGLEKLALQKLHDDLVSFRLFETRIGDIVHLLRYTYGSTAQLTDSPCPLRDLVTGFSACRVKVLWRSVEFQSLFISCGELAGDLFSESMKRMD